MLYDNRTHFAIYNYYYNEGVIMLKKSLIITSVLLILVSQAHAVRDYINIVGSSTVYPFAEVVADKFNKKTKFKRPRIESTGSGFGFKLFCAGVGVDYPDITNASRAIKKSEIDKCNKNDVKDIIEVKIGYDGIAIASDKNAMDFKLTLKEVFLALAKDVPDPKGVEKFVSNPYKTWQEINSNLPALKIKVLGPPPTSGTRDAFEELVMEGGCKKIGWIKAIKKKDKAAYKDICHTIREDGVYIESGENDNLIVQKLITNPNALGIFGFSFLDQNRNIIKGSTVEGIKPTFATIINGSYPISRPLFFYVKKANVDIISGINIYLKEFTSEKALSAEGYLSKHGLIPLPKNERQLYRDNINNLKSMK